MSNSEHERGEPAAGQRGDVDETTGEAVRTSHGERERSEEELRRDIEQTREGLGDTVDALSQKADVKAQVKGVADEQKAALRAKRYELKQKVSAGGGGGGDAAERAKQLLDDVAERTSRRPLPYLGGALAAGVFAGLLLRGRRR